MDHEIKIDDVRKCDSGDCHCCFCMRRRYCEKGCKFCNGKNGMKDSCTTTRKQAPTKKPYKGRKKTS